MAHISKRRINVAAVPGPGSILHPGTKEIRQPRKPSLPPIPTSARITPQLRRYFLNDTKLLSIAEKSKSNNNCEIDEVTTITNEVEISDMALVAVSYGFDLPRYRAGKRALCRLDRANPKPAKKIFIEVSDAGHYAYLKESDWEYHFYSLTPKMKGLFQKEALWTIGTKLAFEDRRIQKVVLIDNDCAFHDNSWTHHISNSLAKFEFVQPFAAILYSEQYDCGMDTGTIPSIAYCMNTHQTHPVAVPGGSYACTRNFFFNTLGGEWPIDPVGSGDVGFWKTLFGHAPVISSPEERALHPTGQYQNHPIGYTSLLLNHYYHGPMSNRMYRTREYISHRCFNGSTVVKNKDGILEWSDNSMSQVMQTSMLELKNHTDAYLQVNRAFTVVDTKNLFKQQCKKIIGGIDKNNPLVIATVYKKNGIYTIAQINALRDAVKKTFKCPFKFRVVTDAKYAFPQEEVIETEFPSHLIPPGYEWIMATGMHEPDNTSILYLDPTVKLKGTCDMVPCSDTEVFLAHPGKNWNMKILYFKSLMSVNYAFSDDMCQPEKNPNKLYNDPADYFVSTITNASCYKLRDVLFHVDYTTASKTTDPIANIII